DQGYDLKIQLINFLSPVNNIHALPLKFVMRIQLDLMLNSNLPEPLEKVCDCCRSPARPGLFNQGNDGTPNDSRIGKFANGGYVFRGRDAEAHRNRQPSEAAQTLDQAARIGSQILLRP